VTDEQRRLLAPLYTKQYWKDIITQHFLVGPITSDDQQRVITAIEVHKQRIATLKVMQSRVMQARLEVSAVCTDV
jgi:predicted transcriptional regulator